METASDTNIQNKGVRGDSRQMLSKTGCFQQPPPNLHSTSQHSTPQDSQQHSQTAAVERESDNNRDRNADNNGDKNIHALNDQKLTDDRDVKCIDNSDGGVNNDNDKKITVEDIDHKVSDDDQTVDDNSKDRKERAEEDHAEDCEEVDNKNKGEEKNKDSRDKEGEGEWDVDPLSIDLYDRLCMENIVSKDKEEGKDRDDVDKEEKDVDPLSIDLYDRLCMENVEGNNKGRGNKEGNNIVSKDKGDGKDRGDMDKEEWDADPLSVDLYDGLCMENVENMEGKNKGRENNEDNNIVSKDKGEEKDRGYMDKEEEGLDSLSIDLYDRLCMKNVEGKSKGRGNKEDNIASKDKGEGKDRGDMDKEEWDVDPLSIDLYDRLCMENVEGKNKGRENKEDNNMVSKDKGEGKDRGDMDKEEWDVDPLSIDLYDRLCVENMEGKNKGRENKEDNIASKDKGEEKDRGYMDKEDEDMDPLSVDLYDGLHMENVEGKNKGKENKEDNNVVSKDKGEGKDRGDLDKEEWDVDPLSIDLYDRLCMENVENMEGKNKGRENKEDNIVSKDKGEEKDRGYMDKEDEDVDPLSIDLYDRLRMENVEGKNKGRENKEEDNIASKDKGEEKDRGYTDKEDDDVDPLSVDLYDKLCMENVNGKDENSKDKEDNNIVSKDKGEGKDKDNKDKEEEDVDPQSVDLCNRLCSENRMEDKEEQKRVANEDKGIGKDKVAESSSEGKDKDKDKGEGEADRLRIDQYDRLCTENMEGKNKGNKDEDGNSAVSEDKGEEKDGDGNDEGEEDVDPLSVDLYDRVCMENRMENKEKWKNMNRKDKRVRKNTASKDIGEENDGEKDKEEGEVDPLSVDLYDRLCVENGVEDSEVLQWDSYLVGEDLQKACKKLSISERQFHAILVSIFLVVTFAMVLGLFVLQAQMSMNSREMVTKVQAGRKEIPQGMYNLYFDYLESRVLPENADLRVNTSIFVH